VTTWYDLVERAADEQRTADLALLIEEAPDGKSARRARELTAGGTAEPAGAVFLFAGLMVDRPGAERARLPPEAVEAAAVSIDTALRDLGARTGDRAVTGGACGGDLLFAEAALRHGLRLDLLIPFEIPEFLEQSVAFAGAEWVERFNAVVTDDLSTLHVMPNAVGDTAPDGNPYERTNRWLVHHARSGNPERFNLIVLWDGRPGRGPGGTGDLYDRATDLATEKRIIKPGIGEMEVETVSLRDRLERPGPKRILALDGGGMRGAITLGYLLELERILARRHGRPVELREYFDLIGGT
jgi:hypothetical protein